MLIVVKSQDITVFNFDGTPTFSSRYDSFVSNANPLSDGCDYGK